MHETFLPGFGQPARITMTQCDKRVREGKLVLSNVINSRKNPMLLPHPPEINPQRICVILYGRIEQREQTIGKDHLKLNGKIECCGPSFLLMQKPHIVRLLVADRKGSG